MNCKSGIFLISLKKYRRIQRFQESHRRAHIPLPIRIRRNVRENGLFSPRPIRLIKAFRCRRCTYRILWSPCREKTRLTSTFLVKYIQPGRYIPSRRFAPRRAFSRLESVAAPPARPVYIKQYGNTPREREGKRD